MTQIYDTDLTICLNDSGSFIAISANTFLFNSTLAFLSLFIKSEYDNPESLTAAFILWIHKLLISLFLVFLMLKYIDYYGFGVQRTRH